MQDRDGEQRDCGRPDRLDPSSPDPVGEHPQQGDRVDHGERFGGVPERPNKYRERDQRQQQAGDEPDRASSR
jgi:hypothetical protein